MIKWIIVTCLSSTEKADLCRLSGTGWKCESDVQMLFCCSPSGPVLKQDPHVETTRALSTPVKHLAVNDHR